ncbi:MAG TPA: mandelate racemase/muconate lactonizing enzyme family protein [Solirubrobacteraceae bacterium]|nr:mandelate racemase/muconate lactonizing enzyme family protein [Solirubrobacteraceae bacterium]
MRRAKTLPTPTGFQRAKAAPPLITNIKATSVNLPLDAPYRWVAGLNHGFTKVVVEVETDAGITGLGEASSWHHAAIISDELAPKLIGCPASDLHHCRMMAVPAIETMQNIEGADVTRAYGAIEIALWDVCARRAELPLYRLLGGAVRKRIPFTEYFAARPSNGSAGGYETPEEIGAYCEQMVAEFGSPFFEGKVGYADLETDIEVARNVRHAIGPRRALSLDANMGWRVPTARAALRRLAEFEIANIEDPVGNLDDMAKLRQHTTIPFSTHVPDLRSAARLGVPDRIVLNLTAVGGIEPTLRVIAACEALGIEFSFYSGETGIGVAAYLHVAAADAHLGTPSQSLVRWYSCDVIKGGPFVPVEGHLQVPEEPGLGVELDRTALGRAAEAFREHGPLDMTGLDHSSTYRRPPLY